MSDYISRKEVLKALDMLDRVATGDETDSVFRVDAMEAVENMPGIPMLTPDEANNIAEMIELNFYRYVKEMYEIDAVDNIGWAESILSGWRKLERMAKDD